MVDVLKVEIYSKISNNKRTILS